MLLGWVSDCHIAGQESDSPGFITDSFQIGNGFDDGDHQPQVRGCRRSCRQYPTALFVNANFQLVYLAILRSCSNSELKRRDMWLPYCSNVVFIFVQTPVVLFNRSDRSG
jgi:hypothetical protein